MIPKENEPESDQIDQLNNYVNKPHIRQLIIDKDLTSGKKDHGRVIYASIANNPHNLVYGPSGEYRGADPGGMKDNELYNAQSPEYKNDVQTYEENRNLDTFGNIRAAQPVQWEERRDPDPNNTDNKYFVRQPNNENI